MLLRLVTSICLSLGNKMEQSAGLEQAVSRDGCVQEAWLNLLSLFLFFLIQGLKWLCTE